LVFQTRTPCNEQSDCRFGGRADEIRLLPAGRNQGKRFVLEQQEGQVKTGDVVISWKDKIGKKIRITLIDGQKVYGTLYGIHQGYWEHKRKTEDTMTIILKDGNEAHIAIRNIKTKLKQVM
jgi:hypothetical protein